MHQQSPQGVPVRGRKSKNRSSNQDLLQDSRRNRRYRSRLPLLAFPLVVGNYAKKGLTKLLTLCN